MTALVLVHGQAHVRNDRRNPEGGVAPASFDLQLFRGPERSIYELIVTSKVVLDFDHFAEILPAPTRQPGYRRQWAERFQEVVEQKWGAFRLVDRRSSTFFVRIKVRCVTQTPDTKTTDYHIWAWLHPRFSFMAAPQPSFYRGTVWHLRPEDVEGKGNAAHEFGHMLGVTHVSDPAGDRLMYGNDRQKSSEHYPGIKNDPGYVYPEQDLAFHRDWVLAALRRGGLVDTTTRLFFEPSRRK